LRHRTGKLVTIPGVIIAALSAAALTSLAAVPTAVAANAQGAASATSSSQSYNGLALTPPMGWNDWYEYKCNVTQADVLANARALVRSGLARLGYDYVNLDDCWMAPTRAANGELQADPTRFPNGIGWLASQIHHMGLKLGVYESFGTRTCQGKPGSLGHYAQDAQTFASWGVDFLKFDYCGPPSGLTNAQAEADYQQMSQDLIATGRPIVFSEELPIRAGNADPANSEYLPYVSFSSQISNMWRVAPDVTTDFDSTVFGHLAQDLPLAGYAHPGAWNDLDMLPVGNTTFNWTVQQEETQMSIWAEMASPLLASTDLASMSRATRQILGNRAVIAVDQDRLGKQGQLVAHEGPVDVVAKPLANGDVAVLLANSSSAPQQATTTASAVGLGSAPAYTATDLWAHATRETAGTIAATVPPESAMLLQVAPLRGPASRYAPLTDVSVIPDVPALYPGSQFTVAAPGQTITVPAALSNDGREPVTDASLSLDGPAGWSTTGPPVSARFIPGDGQLSGTWQVTVPSGTPAGSYTLTGTASYRWNGFARGVISGEGAFQVDVAPAGTPYLDQLSWLSESTSQGSGVVIDKNVYGGPLTIHGVVYPHGLWVNSVATIYYYLGGNCTQFTADLGLDDSDEGTGAVDYQFYADGTQVYDSGVVANSTPTVQASVNVTGAQVLELHVAEGNGTVNFGNADFGNPQLTCNS
jgi:alpha-galactosidase